MSDKVCVYCGKPIYFLSYAGWVEVASSEQGGNYDLCVKNPPYLHHRPYIHHKVLTPPR